MPFLGFGETVLDPRDHGLVACREFSGIGSSVAQVVARTLNINSDISDAFDRPAAILYTGHELIVVVQKNLGRLELHGDGILALRKRCAEKPLPLVIEPLA